MYIYIPDLPRSSPQENAPPAKKGQFARDKRLVIAPIRIYYRHYKMHTVNIAYQSAVFFYPPNVVFPTYLYFPFNVFSLDYFNIDAFILSLFRAHGIQNHPKVLNAVNNKGYPQSTVRILLPSNGSKIRQTPIIPAIIPKARLIHHF